MDDIVLGALDFLVVLLIVTVSASVGLYFRYLDRKRCKISETLIREMDMPLLPVALSIAITAFNSKEVRDTAELSYYIGLKIFFDMTAIIPAIGLCLFVYGAILFESRTPSVYEYLERRFGITLRRIGTVQFIVCSIIYAGHVMNSTATVFMALTGTSVFATVIFTVFICMFYCFIGGIKAVILSNTIQVLVLYVVIILLTSKAVSDVGGFRRAWKIASEAGLMDVVSFDFSVTSGNTFWEISVGTIIWAAYYVGLYQPLFQIAMCCRTPKQRKLAVFVGIVLRLILHILSVLFGMTMRVSLLKCYGNTYAFDLEVEEKIIPHFVRKHASTAHGLPGLIVAALFGGMLGAISIIVLSLATTTFQDILRPLFSVEDLSHKNVILATKLLTILYGMMFICGAMAFAATTKFVLFGEFIMEGVSAIQVGVFTLGMLCRRPNQKGMLAAIAVSQLISLWLSAGQTVNPTSADPLCNDSLLLSNMTVYSLKQTDGSLMSNGSEIRSLLHEALANTTGSNISSRTSKQPSTHVFPLYTISKPFYMLLILMITVSVGYMVSWKAGNGQAVPPELLFSPSCCRRIDRSHSKEKEEEEK